MQCSVSAHWEYEELAFWVVVYKSTKSMKSLLACWVGVQLNADGSDVEALEHWLHEALQKDEAQLPIPFPVCQLLIGFGHPRGEEGILRLRHGSPSDVVHRIAPRVLKALGMQLESCVQGDSHFATRCLFYSLVYCPTEPPTR